MSLGLFVGLVPLLVVAAVIAGIVAIARRDDGDDLDPGIGTVRRLVLYGLLFGAAMLGPTGVGLLLGGMLEAATGGLVISESDTELAVGLSLTIVGAVAWLILWRIAASTVAAHPVERRSLARHLYFGSVKGVALIAMMVAGTALLRVAFGLDGFDGNSVSFLVVGAVVWYAHERMQAPEASASDAVRSLRRLYLFGAAFIGLAVLAGGLTWLLDAFFERAYDAILSTALADGPGGGLVPRGARDAAPVVIVGAIAWAAQWWRARDDSSTTIWRVYIFLGGLLSGITTAIVAASVVLHLSLQWFFGDPSSSTAAAHFSGLPYALAGLLVGLLLWGYHRAVLAEHTRAVDAPASETERVYRYLAAAAGLATLVVGLARVLATASDLLADTGPSFTGTPGWWQNQLVLGVTLLLVGVPIWVRYWRHVEAHAAAGGEGERGAVSRRIFLYAVFGISGLAVLIALSTALFELFQAILNGRLSTQLLHDARWGIAVVLSAAGVAAYHWQVLRLDQRAQPEAPERPSGPRTIEVTLVAGEEGGALALQLQQRLSARVRVWRRADTEAGAPSAPDIDALVSQIEAAPGARLLVIVSAGGSTVIPYAAA